MNLMQIAIYTMIFAGGALIWFLVERLARPYPRIYPWVTGAFLTIGIAALAKVLTSSDKNDDADAEDAPTPTEPIQNPSLLLRENFAEDADDIETTDTDDLGDLLHEFDKRHNSPSTVSE